MTKILTYRKTNTSSGGSGGPKVTPYVPDPHLSLPEALDWRSRGAVSAVKDQVMTNTRTHSVTDCTVFGLLTNH